MKVAAADPSVGVGPSGVERDADPRQRRAKQPIDPLSGEGIHSAFLSATLAAEAIVALVRGRSPDLRPYAYAILSALGGLPAASWGGRAAFDRFPRTSYAFLRTPQAWHAMKRIFQGRAAASEAQLLIPRLLARLGGDPAKPYLEELAH